MATFLESVGMLKSGSDAIQDVCDAPPLCYTHARRASTPDAHLIRDAREKAGMQRTPDEAGDHVPASPLTDGVPAAPTVPPSYPPPPDYYRSQAAAASASRRCDWCGQVS